MNWCAVPSRGFTPRGSNSVPEETWNMGDVIAVAYGVLVFAILIGYVIACEAV